MFHGVSEGFRGVPESFKEFQGCYSHSCKGVSIQLNTAEKQLCPRGDITPRLKSRQFDVPGDFKGVPKV